MSKKKGAKKKIISLGEIKSSSCYRRDFVAALFGVSPSTIRYWLKTNKIHANSVGLILGSSLIALRESKKA